MIHLFGRVYLTTDYNIDYNYDRVVCSEKFGVQNLSSLEELSGGSLITYAKSTDILVSNGDWLSFFSVLAEHYIRNKTKVIVYADKESFIKIYVGYLKNVLKNPTLDTVRDYIELCIFRNKLFDSATYGGDFDFTDFDNVYKNTVRVSNTKRDTFVSDYSDHLSIEFLLSTYLTNGTKLNSLSKSFSPLIEKDIDQYIEEAKTIFFLNLTNTSFCNALGITPYTYQNVEQSLNSDNKFVQFMFSDKTVKTMTSEDIETLNQFMILIIQYWKEFGDFSVLTEKLKFIKSIQTKLTEKDVNDIINFERQSNTSTTSFISPALVTVNNFLFREILSNSETAKKFVV